MMFLKFITCICFCCFLIVGCEKESTTKVSDKSSPKKVEKGVTGGPPELTLISPERIDFGTFPSRQEKQTSFKIKNTGDSKLVLKHIRKTCGCFTIKNTQKELAPEEETEIKVIVEANGLQGAFSKCIFVETNDPTHEVKRLFISGTATPLLKIKPQAKLYVGTIRNSKPWSQSFIFESTEKILDLSTPIVKGHDKVTATLSAIKVKVGARPKYKLKLAMPAGVPKGRFNVHIEIPVIKPLNVDKVAVQVYGIIK